MKKFLKKWLTFFLTDFLIPLMWKWLVRKKRNTLQFTRLSYACWHLTRFPKSCKTDNALEVADGILNETKTLTGHNLRWSLTPGPGASRYHKFWFLFLHSYIEYVYYSFSLFTFARFILWSKQESRIQRKKEKIIIIMLAREQSH